MRRLFLFLFILMVHKNSHAAHVDDARSHHSIKSLENALQEISTIQDDKMRTEKLDDLWRQLKIPFIAEDTVAFLYRGQAYSVSWNGDFNGWGSDSTMQTHGSRIGFSDIWLWEKSFPRDARLDYKIVIDEHQWILDPSNPDQQWSGFGPNSELRMPEYVFPKMTIRHPDIPRGELSDNIFIYSGQLGYDVQYRVYQPSGYKSLKHLPVIYILDGHEYLNDQLGSMVILLDNLIGSGVIQPVMAIFIDPRDPHYPEHNRRLIQYNINTQFAAFIAQELIPSIDRSYATDPASQARGILGTSVGGLAAAYFGACLHESFRLIAIQSPSFGYNQEIFSLYEKNGQLPLKIYMSTGTIHDTKLDARRMRSIYEEKGYQLKYREVNEGHSWGNWRALIAEILIYFFGSGMKGL